MSKEAEITRILYHIEAVRNFMQVVAMEILSRGQIHDQSKLSPQELDAYCLIMPMLRKTEYGTPEYKLAAQSLGPALEHHQTMNPHHPEFFEKGIDGMNLIDLLEMLCDWHASSLRKSGDPEAIFKSIEIAVERWGLSSQLRRILHNTAVWINQQDVEHSAEKS